jgi:hypothetical protein
MFHPVIAVDSAKKAMEFLRLKDGGGKVTTAEHLPPFPCRRAGHSTSWSFTARGRSSAWAPAPPVGDPAAQRSAPGRAVPYGPRVCACARDGFCSVLDPPLFWKQKVAAFHGGKAKENPLPLPAVRLTATLVTDSLLHPQSCALFSATATAAALILNY